MKVLIINPNTSRDFTRKIQTIAVRYAQPSTEILVVNPERGPRSIEGIYDVLLSSVSTLELVISRQADYDGMIFACYSDHPVISAAREITKKPVLGIAEASMYYACMVGYTFSIITTNQAWEPLLWDAVRRYGLQKRCASIRATGMAVQDLEGRKRGPRARILENAQKAVNEDQAEVICLGCAGMVGLDKELTQHLGVPVIDGVVAALKLMEGLLEYGVTTSMLKRKTSLS